MEDFNSKYTGEEVEQLLDQVASGNAGGGGGGITVETDPIFSGSPAADITEEKMAEWDNKYAKPSGGIPQSDLAEEVKGALRKAEQYTGTVTEIKVNGNNIGASGGVVDLGNLGTYSKPTTGIPKSDLNSSVQASLEKADTAVQPADIKDDVYIADFTMYSLRTGMNSGTDVDCNIQALVTAMNANKVILVREDENLEGVHVLNGFAEDLLYFSIVDSSGNILWCDGVDYTVPYIDGRNLHFHYWRDKQDTLKSGSNIKTINGQSILGSGNITIEGGGNTISSTIFLEELEDNGNRKLLIDKVGYEEHNREIYSRLYNVVNKENPTFSEETFFVNIELGDINVNIDRLNGILSYKDELLFSTFTLFRGTYTGNYGMFVDVELFMEKYTNNEPMEFVISINNLDYSNIATTDYIDTKIGDINNVLETILG